MKLYRLTDAVIVDDGTCARSYHADWDELINREDLHSFLTQLTSRLDHAPPDWIDHVVAPDNRSCALGPCVLVTNEMLDSSTEIRLDIQRQDEMVFKGSTTLAQLKRTPKTLVEFLYRDNSFPRGCILLSPVLESCLLITSRSNAVMRSGSQSGPLELW